jgi:coenzyme F420-reducing hydrogenase gamma subunit
LCSGKVKVGSLGLAGCSPCPLSLTTRHNSYISHSP